MKSATVTTCPLCRAATLYHISTERFKTARLTFTTVRPADERESPLATLLYGILRRGSEHYPRLALFNRRLDELYGTTLTIRNYLQGDNHIISLTAEMPEDAFLPAEDGDLSLVDGVLELLADMLLRPLTDENGLLRIEAVEAEKQSLCDSLRALSNDTRAYAGDRFRRLMCPDEPYGLCIGGTVESVSRITSQDVTEHWRRHMDSLAVAMFYVGRTPADHIKCLWDRHFGGWDPTPVALPATILHRPPDTPRRVEEEMPVAQGKLCMGWSGGGSAEALADPNALAARLVCNELFGTMQSSLLFRHVRERLGLCYYCDSALDTTKDILWVSCGVRPDRRDEAEAAITAQLADLQAGRIAPADVTLAKLSLENTYRQIEDSQGAMESWQMRRLLGEANVTPAEMLAAIRAVTLGDVTRAAQSYRPDTVYFLKGTAPMGAESDEWSEEDAYADD